MSSANDTDDLILCRASLSTANTIIGFNTGTDANAIETQINVMLMDRSCMKLSPRGNDLALIFLWHEFYRSDFYYQIHADSKVEQPLNYLKEKKKENQVENFKICTGNCLLEAGPG